MSFFDFQDRESVTGEFESGGGNFEPIPANTNVLAAPDEAKWDEYQDQRYISLRWIVLAPEDYKNRRVFQKIRVLDDDSAKAEKAKRMLAAIDANAGGRLLASGEEPTDSSLTMALVNKPMVLKLQVWKLTTETGEEKTGNWVAAVSPRNAGQAAPAPKAAPVKDEDVPF